MNMQEKNNEDMGGEHQCGNHSMGCGSHGWCGHKKHRWLRVVIWVIVLWLVFSAGYSLGKLKAYLGYGIFGYGTGMRAPYGMMGSGGQWGWQGMRSMMSGRYDGDEIGGWGMMSRWFGGNQKNGADVFGTVVKIDGNKITVTDNGGKEQTIVSASDTVMYNGNGEVGLSALKAGQSIRASGVLKDNQFNAQEIRLY